MKKLIKTFSSMKFGIILLILIGILCVVATAFEKTSIYASWYFIALFLLLAFNLFFCSVVRVKNIKTWRNNILQQAQNGSMNFEIADAEKWLNNKRFKKNGDAFIKNNFGLYGTFLTHLSMLLLTIASVYIFMFTVSEDYTIPVNTTQTLEDGTAITVKSFSMEDDEKNVEYKSSIIINMPDGTVKECEVLVNHPVSFGRYKLYQQSYVYSAVIGAKTSQGDEEIIRLDEPSFLTLDDKNGIFYASLFTNVVEENGEVKVTQSSELINPAYEINIIKGDDIESKLAFPDSAIEIAGVIYSFYEPEINPGLLIKEQPAGSMALLYISFIMMLVGLYACFFCIPEAAAIKENGICFVSRKNTEQRLAVYLNDFQLNKDKENE